MISYAFILITSSGLGRLRGAGRIGADRSRRRDQECSATPEQEAARFREPSILGPVRRLGWFLVGAAGATGALVAAPGLYGKLREAVGAGDPWNEFQPDPDGGYASLREDPPVYAAAAPEPAVEVEPDPEPPVDVAPESEPEPEPESDPETVVEVQAEAVSEAAVEPEAEPEPPAEASGVYETVVWPVPNAQSEESEPAAEDAADEDDTGEITSTLTPAPPPEDTEATDLRSRIEASRERLRNKAQGGVEEEDEVDEVDPEPDQGA
jgi:hypothetical protein